jgi:glucose/arabinose dehydrogenase
MLFGQKNSVQPQPQADKLSQITPPTRGAGGRGPVQTPEGVKPTVPAGFTISTYAEMPSPRIMVYAPNGDLFVASTATSTIRVFRDANNDGTFEAQGTYA